MRPASFDICVVGAGPAGSTIAARLVQLGHKVCLIERARFPRRHIGESLSPGVLPLLEATGARSLAENAQFIRFSRVFMKWGADLQERDAGGGTCVDRGQFDHLLSKHAQRLGVTILQPARINRVHRTKESWRIEVRSNGEDVHIEAAFLADATGRSGLLPRRRQRCGPPTTALYAYWRGDDLPQQPRIIAGAEAWYWGLPLPDGSYNTIVFAAAGACAAKRFNEWIARSELMPKQCDASLQTPVMAADATPYIDDENITAHSIKVGDAALALDPLSSSGVQKAIQTALAGAVAVNTILRLPERKAVAMHFYRSMLEHASERHRVWAAEHYSKVANAASHPFWRRRAGPAPEARPSLERKIALDSPAELSPLAAFVNLPCIDGDFVTVKPALQHPELDRPVAFAGGWEVAPLLQSLPAGLTPRQIAMKWSDRLPVKDGIQLTAWLLRSGVLVQPRL